MASDAPCGSYLTDGSRLYWVCESSKGLVLLEDCAKDTQEWWTVGEILADMKYVEPAKSEKDFVLAG